MKEKGEASSWMGSITYALYYDNGRNGRVPSFRLPSAKTREAFFVNAIGAPK